MTTPLKVPADMPVSEVRKLVRAALRRQRAVTIIIRGEQP